MRAVVLESTQSPVAVQDVQLEPPRGGEVLVRLAASGVCHSDLHVAHGALGAVLPCVLGHEGAGVVEAVGPGVSSLAPGDHVVLLWVGNCGHCFYCVEGRPGLCDLGVTLTLSGKLLDGTTRLSRAGQPLHHFLGVSAFAEYAVVVESAAVRISPEIPLEIAALVGCAVLTGVGAAIYAAQLRPGMAVAVFGAGGVGLNAIQGAALCGAYPIVAVDRVPAKLTLAREFGATQTVDSSRDDVAAAIQAATDGQGVDVAIEAIGNPVTIRQAYDALRRGGRAVQVGAAPLGAEMPFSPWTLPLLEKSLVGTLYGSTRPRTDIPRLLKLYRAGRLKLDQLITRRYRLDQVQDAFAAMERGELARGIITYS
jgi:NDMA-dependent alcohol dehydrogenase